MTYLCFTKPNQKKMLDRATILEIALWVADVVTNTVADSSEDRCEYEFESTKDCPYTFEGTAHFFVDFSYGDREDPGGVTFSLPTVILRELSHPDGDSIANADGYRVAYAAEKLIGVISG